MTNPGNHNKRFHDKLQGQLPEDTAPPRNEWYATIALFVFGVAVWCALTFNLGIDTCMGSPSAPYPQTRLGQLLWHLPSEWQHGYAFEKWNNHGVCYGK